ncbi:MAG: hypothetical protein ACJAR6_000511 [Oleispira sp.]|jgi:hypothetical protein
MVMIWIISAIPMVIVNALLFMKLIGLSLTDDFHTQLEIIWVLYLLLVIYAVIQHRSVYKLLINRKSAISRPILEYFYYIRNNISLVWNRKVNVLETVWRDLFFVYFNVLLFWLLDFKVISLAALILVYIPVVLKSYTLFLVTRKK